MKILDGRREFYQWDVNVKITSERFEEGDAVHFDNGTTKEPLLVTAYRQDGEIVAEVPNILLQKARTVKAYIYVQDGDSSLTKYSLSFGVRSRPKPPDYVYTETEVLNYRTLDERVRRIETFGVAESKVEDAVVKYFEENPIDFDSMENVENKVTKITAESNDKQYPSARATFTELEKKEDTANRVTKITAESTDKQYPSARATFTELEKKEDITNRVIEMTSGSTDKQYPSAKAVYDALSKKEDRANKVTEITADSTDKQYPSARAVFNALAANTGRAVPQMSLMDEMMFEKFGTGEKDYYFSQANWDDLQRYNRAYVQCYDEDDDLRLGDDGKGMYALKAICRFGAGTVPRYPWMKKSDWVAKYREINPETALSDEEIIKHTHPEDADFGNMATLIERQPNGFIKVPTGFPTDKTEAQMEGYTVPKKYADKIKEIALGAVQKVDCPDKNRYAYTTSMNSKGESIVSLIKMGANPTADVNQPLIRRRVNGAVSTIKIPQADDDAASKYYAEQLFNGANKAVSYQHYSSMVNTLNQLASNAYNVGQNIMIMRVDVPDLWVSAVNSSASYYTFKTDDSFVAELKSMGYVNVGYYTLSMLETQKVDLTDYVRNEALAEFEDRLSDIEEGTITTDEPKGNTSKQLTEPGYYYIELCKGLTPIGQGTIYYSGATGFGGKVYIKSLLEKYEGYVQITGTGALKIYTLQTDGSCAEETSTLYKLYTAKLNI